MTTSGRGAGSGRSQPRCVVCRIAAEGEPLVEALPADVVSLADAVRLERPGGVYAAFGTWNDRRVILLSAHFDRLEDSAGRVGFPLRLDRALIRSELCTIMRDAGLAGARIRLSAHPDDLAAKPPLLLVSLEPFAGPPVALREQGVACRTARRAARSSPEAKQTGWLDERRRLGDSASDPPPYEWLLLDDDERILEGSSSNFYAIRDGAPDGRPALETASDGILPGIARSIVLDVAREVCEVRLVPPRAGDIGSFSEAFITSSSRGIVPVVEIDGAPIGDGTPGPVTQELSRRYDERARALEEPLCEA